MRARFIVFGLGTLLFAARPAGAAKPGDSGPSPQEGPGATAESPPDVPAEDSAPPTPPAASPGTESAVEKSERPPAAATGAPKPVRPAVPDAEADSAPPEVRPARDTLGGHIIVGAMAGLFVPFGSFESGVTQQSLLDTGIAVGGDIGIGISRTLVLGVYGEVGLPSASSACAGCSVMSIAVGPMVRYHLVQGLKFDPWLAFGAGYRRTSTGHDTFTGVDWARLELGGDYYPWPSLGLGPFVALSIGSYVAATTQFGSASVDSEFSLGLRVVFDSPGK